MKCLNCNGDCNYFLCKDCLNDKNIESYVNKIIKRDTEFISNSLNDFLETCSYEEKCNCMSTLLSFYNGKEKEYYNCKLLKMKRDASFEVTATKYVNEHDFSLLQTQDILYDLLWFYFRNDYITPQIWYSRILNENDLCYELYYNAAEYFSMVGDYKESEFLLTKIENSINEINVLNIKNTKELIISKIQQLKKLLERYRNGTPYWPNTEERRKQIASIYDSKGIKYKGSIKIRSYKKNKIKEDEFEIVNECDDYAINTYCSFWCNYVENINGIKDIYEIAAIRVVNGSIVNEFTKFIRPWDGSKYIEKAAKQRNIDYTILDHSEEVEEVIKEFVDFIGNDVLIATGALGNQLKVLIRAFRYSGRTKIENKFLDILDFAADTDEQFDMENNTRKFLLKKFTLVDGVDAKSKALNNIKIFNGLKEWK